MQNVDPRVVSVITLRCVGVGVGGEVDKADRRLTCVSMPHADVDPWIGDVP